MLRQSQLPPRAPLRSKEIACHSYEPTPANPSQKNDVLTRHKKSLSHSSALGDQPAWMDHLLSDLNSTPGRPLYRSASDSLAFRVPQSMLHSHNDVENLKSDGSGGAVESACFYGPNSPRKRVDVEFEGNSVLTALSDRVSQLQLPFFQEDSCSSWPSCLDSWGNSVGSDTEINAEVKEEKRHPRQRSRVRKLQYIAELEKTINSLQALESELQYEVSAMVELRLTLSLENGNLKQHMSRLQRKRLVLHSEQQALVREAERLRSGLARLSSQNKGILHQKPRLNHVQSSEDI